MVSGFERERSGASSKCEQSAVSLAGPQSQSKNDSKGAGLILYLVVLVLGSRILNAPAWAYARRHQGASALLPWLGTPALAVWIGLLASNIGQGSLANLIEGAWLMIASVVLAYTQVFIIDRLVKKPTATTAALATILCIAAIILRITMPTLPE